MDDHFKPEDINFEDINDYEEFLKAYNSLNDFEVQHQSAVENLERHIIKNRQFLSDEYIKNLVLKEEKKQLNDMNQKLNQHNHFIQIERSLENSLKEYNITYSNISIDKDQKIDKISINLPDNPEKLVYLYINFETKKLSQVCVQCEDNSEKTLNKEEIMILIYEILESSNINKRKEEIENLNINALPLKLLEFFMSI